MKQAEKHAELFMGRNDTDGNTSGGRVHGQMTAVTDGAIQASKEAVTLCITMLGVMTL